jgi:hypothetical protein
LEALLACNCLFDMPPPEFEPLAAGKQEQKVMGRKGGMGGGKGGNVGGEERTWEGGIV